MSRYVSSHDFQGPNLPARPLQSYQAPNRTRHHTRVTQGSSNKENKLPNCRAVKIRKPFWDATNEMTSLRYNSDPAAFQLPLKPSFLPLPPPQQPFHFTRMQPNSLGLSSDPASTSLCPAQFDVPRAPQTPRSACSSSSSSTLVSSDAEQVVTPTTNRRLAVERVRKAASDAAIRKMGLQGSMGWSDALNKPFKLVPETQPALQTIDAMPSPDQTPAPRGPAYSPRQYTPKPLLLPCKLARSSNMRSPPVSKLAWLSRQGPIAYQQSRSPTAAARNLQFEETSNADGRSPERRDAEEGPSLECHSPRECPYDMTPIDEVFEEGSTTPCDSSFASEHDIGAGFKHSSEFSCPDGHDEDGACDTSDTEADEKDEPAKKTTTVFRWALVASEEIPGKSELSKEPPAPHPHRKSLGCWLAEGLSRDLGAGMATTRSRSYSEPNIEPLPPTKNLTIQESILRKIIPMDPVARPTFSLPCPDKRSHVWSNLRKIASPRALWPTLLSHVPQLSLIPCGIPPI